MSQTFLEFLEIRKPSSESLQQAARFCLAESTDDLSYDEMRLQVIQSVNSVAKVDEILESLESRPRALENAALDILMNTWGQPNGQTLVISAIDDAEKSLPITEVGILAIMAMYFAYLVITEGVKKEETIIERLPDGSLRTITRRELYGPTGPLSELGKLFGRTDK